MLKPIESILTDLFGTKDLINKTNLFKKFLKQENPNLDWWRSRDKFGVVE